MKFIKSVVKATAASLAIMSPGVAYLAINMSSTPQKAIAITALLALLIAMLWPYLMQPSKKNTYFCTTKVITIEGVEYKLVPTE